MIYETKLVKWFVLTGLALSMAGCPGGDDGDTGSMTGPLPPTTSVGNEGTATGDESTGTPATTTGAESTGDPDTTTGAATCDPPCEAGQECIEGTCFDLPGEDSSSGEPPPPDNSDYGPCNMCAAGESPVMIGGIEGCFCSPACVGMSCPAPNEGTGQGMCVLELMMGAGPTQCALICGTTEDCPAGATCEAAGGAGVCVHPAP